MSELGNRRRGLFAELRRRHVVRTTLGYAAMVFVVLQLGEIVFPAFQTSAEADHLIRILVVGAVLLFPIVVVMAWVYEITPMGIRSMAVVDSEAGLEPHGSLSHRAALMGVTIAAVVAAGVWWRQTEEWIPETRSFRTAAIFQGAQTTDADGPIGSLAVLPLEDLSAEPGQEYFAPGMHEALLSELSQIDFLRVISRTTVTQYRPGGRSMSQIGQDLNVDAIVEGSVLRADGRIRITVQLIHAASDTHLWSQSYERELENVIALQSEVAQAVSVAIESLLDARRAEGEPLRLASVDPTQTDEAVDATDPETSGESETSLGVERGTGEPATPAGGTRSARALPEPDAQDPLEAHSVGGGSAAEPPEAQGFAYMVKGNEFTPEMQETFMRGRVALFGAPTEGGAHAEQFFRTVLEVDSSFVPALAGLAGALLTEAGDLPEVNVQRIEAARDVATRAVALAPENREAVEVLRSTEEALQAIRGGGEDVRVITPTTQLGQLVQEKVARIEVMEAPDAGRSAVRSFVRMMATGRLEDAEELGDNLLDQGVDDLVVWESLEQLNRLRKDAEGLVDVRLRRREIRGREPGASIRDLVERMEQDGANGYWSWKVDEAQARSEQDLPVYWTPVATAQLALGDATAALGTLQSAVERREPLLATLRHDPVWDAVRADGRYQAMVRRMRIEPPRGPGLDGRR